MSEPDWSWLIMVVDRELAWFERLMWPVLFISYGGALVLCLWLFG